MSTTIGIIENFHIGLNQMWHGKKVCTLSAAEVLAMEDELRKFTSIGKFTYDAGGEGDVNITWPSEPVKTNTHNGRTCSINIGGKHYNSWEEVKADAGKNGIIVTENCNGKSITISNGVVYLNGQRQSTFDPSKQVILYVFGNTGDIECQEGSVTVYGNVADATAHMGNISCDTIEGDAEAHMGNISATTIEGGAEASMGNIIYKK